MKETINDAKNNIKIVLDNPTQADNKSEKANEKIKKILKKT